MAPKAVGKAERAGYRTTGTENRACVSSLGQAVSICESFYGNPQTLQSQLCQMDKDPCFLVSGPGNPSLNEGPLLPPAGLDQPTLLDAFYPPSGSHDDTMLQFIKPCIPTQVTVTWPWAQGLTLPFPAEHLSEQAGFSSSSYRTCMCNPCHHAKAGISRTSAYVSVKWVRESHEPSILGTL